MIPIPPNSNEVWVLAGDYRRSGASKGEYVGCEDNPVWATPLVQVKFPDGPTLHQNAEDVFASQEEAEAEIALRVLEDRREEENGSTDLIHWQRTVAGGPAPAGTFPVIVYPSEGNEQ